MPKVQSLPPQFIELSSSLVITRPCFISSLSRFSGIYTFFDKLEDSSFFGEGSFNSSLSSTHCWACASDIKGHVKMVAIVLIFIG